MVKTITLKVSNSRIGKRHFVRISDNCQSFMVQFNGNSIYNLFEISSNKDFPMSNFTYSQVKVSGTMRYKKRRSV